MSDYDYVSTLDTLAGILGTGGDQGMIDQVRHLVAECDALRAQLTRAEMLRDQARSQADRWQVERDHWKRTCEMTEDRFAEAHRERDEYHKATEYWRGESARAGDHIVELRATIAALRGE